MPVEPLFTPLTIGPMTVSNRLVMAPMERNYANADGTVSERTIAHYRARAHGGVGWIDVESTFVDPAGRGRTHQLGLHEDGCIDGMRRLVEAVHAEGTKIGIELHHAGRNTCSTISGSTPVAPSPVPCPEAGGEVPRELTGSEIDAILERYAAAATRAAAAGFDAVELHSAHGYLPLAFLSPLTNHRTDEYGGSPENRMRFALRAIEALKGAVGSGLAVGCRFSADERLPGGLTVADTVPYARALVGAGVDYLSVSAGVYASFVNIIPPMDVAAGWLLPTAATIKRAVAVPVIGASRIVDPELAAQAIAAGEVDLVAMGRALLTDPDLPRKARAGRLAEVVTCIGCNQGCEDRISRQRDVTCLVNPEVGRELTLTTLRAPSPRRVVVVGGGPAGIEAARVCAERGHVVTLYERAPRLGGMLTLAAELPDRLGWQTFIEQAERRLLAAGAEVCLGTAADVATLVGSAADAVIIATGSCFERPQDAAEWSGVTVATAAELLGGAGRGSLGELLGDAGRGAGAPLERVVVCGAGAIGLGVAALLVRLGAYVTVVDAGSEIRDPPGQGGLVERLLASGRVTLAADRELSGVSDGAATLVRSDAIGPLFAERLPGVTLVVAAAARTSARDLLVLARRALERTEIHVVGDCRTPRSGLEAVYEGAVVGRKI
jgi:2,4-dienoyl-CoA reductase-like NADH-dependent reductase (Old Yellow Enzyme family)